MSTSAKVNIEIPDSGYFQDAFQFGDAGDTTWNFTGKTFICEVKKSRDDVANLLLMTSGNGRIVVDSVSLRILHFFVSDDLIRQFLPPATYVYDLVMVDGSNNARTTLMEGTLTVRRGVTLVD